MAEICIVCEGSGLRIVQEGGRQVARPCECRVERRVARMLERARIPRRFQESTLENYETVDSSSNLSLSVSPIRALRMAKRFVKGFPLEAEGKGLLFTGSKGLGKTHLAVSILRNLIEQRGASGVFWEHKELLEGLRAAMFGNGSEGGSPGLENRLLRLVTTCDILVLDDLGDMTPSDWTWDTTSFILNARYNANLSTIVTTNLPNSASLPLTSQPYDKFAELRQAVARVSLGDRIGDRMWSRLQEMCVVVEMQGADYRQKGKRANLASGTKQAIGESVPQPALESDAPDLGKAIQEGKAEGAILGAVRTDECVAVKPKPEEEEPVVGAARLGSWAAINRMRRDNSHK